MKKPYSVKGKSTKDLTELSLGEFSTLTRAELSKVVSRLSSTANKRLKNLESKEIRSPAYRGAVKSGGKFGARGKNINELRSEYMRVRGFLKAKTSTIKGYQKVRNELLDRIGAPRDTPEEVLNKMWSIYNEMPNLTGFIQGSGDRQKYIYDVVEDNPYSTTEELIDLIEKRFNVDYEESETENLEENDENDISKYIEVNF